MLKRTLLSLFILTLFLNPVGAEISKERQAEILQLIDEDCSSCHGPNLEGKIGPPLMQYNLRHLPDEYLFHTIKNGRQNSFMPSWMTLLNKEEIYWIIRWLKSEDRVPLNSQTIQAPEVPYSPFR